MEVNYDDCTGIGPCTRELRSVLYQSLGSGYTDHEGGQLENLEYEVRTLRKVVSFLVSKLVESGTVKFDELNYKNLGTVGEFSAVPAFREIPIHDWKIIPGRGTVGLYDTREVGEVEVGETITHGVRTYIVLGIERGSDGPIVGLILNHVKE